MTIHQQFQLLDFLSYRITVLAAEYCIICNENARERANFLFLEDISLLNTKIGLISIFFTEAQAINTFYEFLFRLALSLVKLRLLVVFRILISSKQTSLLGRYIEKVLKSSARLWWNIGSIDLIFSAIITSGINLPSVFQSKMT